MSFMRCKILGLRNGFLFLSLLFLLVACGADGDKTPIQYVPHMSTTSVLKSQRGYEEGTGKGSSMLVPPEGSVAIGFYPYQIKTPEEAGRKLKNPLPFTEKVLARGQNRYETYCAVCHGTMGLGDGPVVPPYPIPKSLQTEQARNFKDGHIFHVITKGQAVMPAYASQIPVKDRWAIIHYVRVLQRAGNPSRTDLEEFEKRKVE